MKHVNGTASRRPTLSGAAMGLVMICALIAAALVIVALVIILVVLLVSGVWHFIEWAF